MFLVATTGVVEDHAGGDKEYSQDNSSQLERSNVGTFKIVDFNMGANTDEVRKATDEGENEAGGTQADANVGLERAGGVPRPHTPHLQITSSHQIR